MVLQRIFFVNHDNGAVGMMGETGADRAEHHPLHAAKAAGSDHDPLGVLGQVLQLRLRPARSKFLVDGDGTSDRQRLPGDAVRFLQQVLCPLLCAPPVVLGHRSIDPRGDGRVSQYMYESQP